MRCELQQADELERQIAVANDRLRELGWMLTAERSTLAEQAVTLEQLAHEVLLREQSLEQKLSGSRERPVSHLNQPMLASACGEHEEQYERAKQGEEPTRRWVTDGDDRGHRQTGRVLQGHGLRVLNDRPDVKAETRERVLAVIRELRWTPDARARGLGRQKSHLLGLLLGNLTSVYVANHIRAVEATARKRGYQLILATRPTTLALERDCLRLFREHRVDGILVMPCRFESPAIVELAGDGVPIGSGWLALPRRGARRGDERPRQRPPNWRSVTSRRPEPSASPFSGPPRRGLRRSSTGSEGTARGSKRPGCRRTRPSS